MRHDAGEGEEGDQVRDGHETVQNIGERPNDIEVHEAAGKCHRDEDDAIGHDGFDAEEINGATFTVVVPSEDGGESKEDETRGEHIATESRVHRGESRIRESCAVEAIIPDAGDDDGEAGQRTNDDGINEGTGHGNETLLRRPTRFRRCRDNRRRTEAGFVGEEAAGDTALHGHHDAGAEETAGRRRRGESVLQNESHRRGNLIGANEKDSAGAEEINHSHGRHDGAGSRGNRLNPTEDDRGDEDEDDARRPDRIDIEGDIDNFDDGIDLGGIADSEDGGEDAEGRKERAEPSPFRAHTVFDVEHRAAGNISFFIDFTILDGEAPFGEFRGHSEEGRHPHPEKSTRAAGMNRGRDADDVPRADGRSQCRTKRFEAGNVPGILIFAGRENQLEGQRQSNDLQKAQAQREENPRADQEHQKRWPPDDAVNRIQ